MAKVKSNNKNGKKIKIKKNVPSSGFNNLLSVTMYGIDFENRIFLIIALDGDDKLDVKLNLISPSCIVSLTVTVLKRFYSLMGNILALMTKAPIKNEQITLLEDANMVISKRVIRNTNLILIKSKKNVKCKLLLTRLNLITLMELEWVISETIQRKKTIERSRMIDQVEEFVDYFISNYENNIESVTVDAHNSNEFQNIVKFVKTMPTSEIYKIISKNDFNFSSELKMFAQKYIYESWLKRRS